VVLVDLAVLAFLAVLLAAASIAVYAHLMAQQHPIMCRPAVAPAVTLADAF